MAGSSDLSGDDKQSSRGALSEQPTILPDLEQDIQAADETERLMYAEDNLEDETDDESESEEEGMPPPPPGEVFEGTEGTEKKEAEQEQQEPEPGQEPGQEEDKGQEHEERSKRKGSKLVDVDATQDLSRSLTSDVPCKQAAATSAGSAASREGPQARPLCCLLPCPRSSHALEAGEVVWSGLLWCTPSPWLCLSPPTQGLRHGVLKACMATLIHGRSCGRRALPHTLGSSLPPRWPAHLVTHRPRTTVRCLPMAGTPPPAMREACTHDPAAPAPSFAFTFRRDACSAARHSTDDT